MKIRLTSPEMLDDVLDKLNETWSFGECNERLLDYCVPSIKERLSKGETIYLETKIANLGGRFCQVPSFWSPDEIPTDKEYLNPDHNDDQ